MPPASELETRWKMQAEIFKAFDEIRFVYLVCVAYVTPFECSVSVNRYLFWLVVFDRNFGLYICFEHIQEDVIVSHLLISMSVQVNIKL